MQLVSGGRFARIYTLLLTSVQLWRPCFSSAKPCTTLPQPVLDICATSRDSVVLVCRSPQGFPGVVFMLYKLREEVATRALQAGAAEVQFTVSVHGGAAGQGELFCCLYKDQEGCYSAFSPYLKLEQRDAAPSFPPPVLSVEPSSGVVRRGDTLSFSCSAPAPPPQPQTQSGSKNKPMTFLLLSTAGRTGATSVVRQPRASRTASLEPQPGVFTVGPVAGGEEGDYTCIYQINKRGPVNSTISNVVHVTISDMLPPPTLVLQQQTDVWHLLCTGPASYPGAVFSLYPSGSELPVASQHAKAIYHHVSFPVPVQDAAVASYQCRYSVLLGSYWSHSEHSTVLAVTKEDFSAATPDVPGVDWPLVLGSFSVAVLFLCCVVLMVVAAHRRVKAAAVKKKTSEEAQLWSQVRARDHIDLTLRSSTFISPEWASGDNEMDHTSPSWNSLSTFTAPIHPH